MVLVLFFIRSQFFVKCISLYQLVFNYNWFLKRTMCQEINTYGHWHITSWNYQCYFSIIPFGAENASSKYHKWYQAFSQKKMLKNSDEVQTLEKNSVCNMTMITVVCFDFFVSTLFKYKTFLIYIIYKNKLCIY